MKMINRWVALYFILLSITIGASFGELPSKAHDLVWSVQGSVYHGSIVGRNNVDGITGASPNTFGSTMSAEYNLKGHFIQAMATFGRTKQTITYGPPAQTVAGEREINLYLLDIPVMYSFHFFSQERFGRELPRLILSAGAFGSIVLHQEIVDTVMKSSDVSSWALGPFLRIAYHPWPFKWLQPGVFLDFYRSFVPNVYDDPLFNENGMAARGILNMGIALRI